jgi:hypothetical protein
MSQGPDGLYGGALLHSPYNAPGQVWRGPTGTGSVVSHRSN